MAAEDGKDRPSKNVLANLLQVVGWLEIWYRSSCLLYLRLYYAQLLIPEFWDGSINVKLPSKGSLLKRTPCRKDLLWPKVCHQYSFQLSYQGFLVRLIKYWKLRKSMIMPRKPFFLTIRHVAGATVNWNFSKNYLTCYSQINLS